MLPTRPNKLERDKLAQVAPRACVFAHVGIADNVRVVAEEAR